MVVIGLGYVGLPLARQACTAGLAVTGIDTAPRVVATLGDGQSPVGDVTDAEVEAMIAAGFRATADPAAVGEADVVVICVPTGLTPDGAPDLGAVRAATATAGTHLRPGTLVVLESTSFPGTTEDVVRPLLEQASGLVAGADFYLGYSPERIDPGNTEFTFARTPKVVSGLTSLCAKRCAAFYETLVDTVIVAPGTREAELAKLLENTYRLVNIALVNELSMICDRTGVDVWSVVELAGTKPFGFASFRPGPGVGGHCIPVDPHYLAHWVRRSGLDAELIGTAHRINTRMPVHVARQAVAMLDQDGVPVAGARVLLLGVTYKPDVPDLRETPAVSVARELRAAGCQVRFHDPLVAAFIVDGEPVPPSADLAGCDVAVLLQDHRCFDVRRIARLVPRLLDTRGRLPRQH
ncbi:nucleotide sugar dehydrogenase [Catenuloplanes japonicus]|uniref:nucleotide sugar dehydrogenase n=1 Tax=Catenuloplanes japonicus TaxID=33876 RepID=UPI0005267687|nr:nucleotide sugar dehydrogenase [Catenuloplanes japonicus]